MKYFLIKLIFSLNSFSFEGDGLRPVNLDLQNDQGAWHEENCKPYKSESIFRTINQQVEDYLFEIKYIRGNGPVDETNDEWYDPLCGKSKIHITNNQDESFSLDYSFDNGYKPSLWKVIKNKLGEKYALFEQSSGGSAGSYIYVASLQSGEMIDALPNSWSFKMEDGKLQNTIIEYFDLDLPSSVLKSCSQVYSKSIEIYLPVNITYVKDQKKEKYINTDYHFRITKKEDFIKECPEVHKNIVQIIESKL